MEKKLIIKVGMTLVGLLILFLVIVNVTKREFSCSLSNGKWIKAKNHCELPLPNIACQVVGGKYNSCASPCRNEPIGGFCVAVCEAVCIK